MGQSPRLHRKKATKAIPQTNPLRPSTHRFNFLPNNFGLSFIELGPSRSVKRLAFHVAFHATASLFEFTAPCVTLRLELAVLLRC